MPKRFDHASITIAGIEFINLQFLSAFFLKIILFLREMNSKWSLFCDYALGVLFAPFSIFPNQ